MGRRTSINSRAYLNEFMKIGVLTFHNALNVGAVLQAYALQTYLITIGHEVEFIDYQPNGRPRTLRDFIGKGPRATLRKWEDLYWTWHYTSKERFNPSLSIGAECYRSIDELEAQPPRFDAYIAGSDQIWNFGKSRRFDRAYFLDFGDTSIRRIAYAASIGQNEILSEDKEAFSEGLKRFNAVSVRERSSVPLIAAVAEEPGQIEQMCDPTFLLTQEQFESIEQKPSDLSDYIVSYLLPHYEMTQELVNATHFVAEELSSEIINLRNPNTCYRLAGVPNQIVTPQKWLGYFKHAKFTVCCSFHAVVFSLIYHKPFIIISPYKNNRIISLLSEVGLSDRCVYSYDVSQIRALIASEIDWVCVDDYFSAERARADLFLTNALG